MIDLGSKVVKNQTTNFVYYCHSISFFASKIEDEGELKEVIEKLIDLIDKKLDSDNYTIALNVLTGMFNAISNTSKNRI